MKKLRILALAITISLMTIMLTGCTTFDHFKAAFIGDDTGKDVTITIGVFEPITGGDSKAATPEIRGIQLAHEVYPNINGKIVELVYSDNSSDVLASETAIKNLFSYNPEIILGSYGSVYSLAASEFINEQEIPTIAMSNTNPLVTKNSPYYYRVCYADSNMGDLLGQYVTNSEQQEFAGVLLPKDNDVALARASAFTDRVEAETGNSDAIKVYEQYEAGSTDFEKQLESIRRSGVKYVLLPGAISDAVEIIKEAANMNLDVIFLGGTEWGTEDFADKVEGYANESNVAYVTYIDPSIEATSSNVSKETQKFLDAYHNKYGNDAVPDDNIALGYDAYLVAIKAVSEAGDNPKGSDIKRILDGDITFEGASGNIRFNDVGDPIKTAYISTITNGNNTLLYTINPVN